MATDILVPLQQEEQDPRHPRQEHLVIIEKDLEKFHRKLEECLDQGWYPRGGDFSIVLERWNVDLPKENE